MNKQFTFKEFKIIPFTKDLAERYSKNIRQALDQISLVESHTHEQLMAETKGERIFRKKWDHGLIALIGDDFAGIIMSYERKSEGNEQYPNNSIYINDFAVAEKYQRKGLGKFLVQAWFKHNKKIGFLELDGDLRFSLQTNSAEWNKHVQALYESFGFRKIATKKYDNRIDNVYFLKP